MNELTEMKETMTSIELLALFNKDRVKTIELKHLHRTVKSMFKEEIKVGTEIQPSLNPDGTVAFYTLNEILSKMFSASKDGTYMRRVNQYWVDKGSEEIKVLSLEEIALSSCQSILNLKIQNDAIQQKQIKQDNRADAFDKRIDKIEQMIGEKASNDKSPDPGYFSIGTLQVKFASKIPIAHVKGLTLEAGTSRKIRSYECSKYIADKNTTSEYIVYNFNDMNRVIDDLIATGIRVGKTQKIKSPLYGSAFKHPMSQKRNNNNMKKSVNRLKNN